MRLHFAIARDGTNAEGGVQNTVHIQTDDGNIAIRPVVTGRVDIATNAAVIDRIRVAHHDNAYVGTIVVQGNVLAVVVTTAVVDTDHTITIRVADAKRGVQRTGAGVSHDSQILVGTIVSVAGYKHVIDCIDGHVFDIDVTAGVDGISAIETLIDGEIVVKPADPVVAGHDQTS